MLHHGQRFCDKFPAARSDKMTNARHMPIRAGGGGGGGSVGGNWHAWNLLGHEINVSLMSLSCSYAILN